MYSSSRKPVRRSLWLGVSAFLLIIAFVSSACGTPSATQSIANTEAAPTAAATQSIANTEAAPTESGPTGEVRIAIGGDVPNFDAHALDDSNQQIATLNIYEALTARDRDNLANIVPRLAESWEQVDATTWRFHLRPGVTFHNGEPFNAAAVVFNYDRAVDPALDSAYVGNTWFTLVEARAVDNLTVDFITTGPDPLLPRRMSFMMMMAPKWAAENPTEVQSSAVGTGPYKFVEWVPGDHVQLTANEAYWGDLPAIRDVLILPRDEPSVRMAALNAGEVEIARGLTAELASQAIGVAQVPGIEVYIFRLDPSEASHVSNPAVRQAMNYAIDRASIIKNIFGGFADPAYGQVIPHFSFGFDPSLEDYPYDPDKARQLLAEAGAQGTKVGIVSNTERWSKSREVTDAIAQMWRDVGLDVEVNYFEWTQYIREQFLNRDVVIDALFIVTSDDLADADRLYTQWYSCEAIQARYCTPLMQDLLSQAREELDPEKRQTLYSQMAQIAYEDSPLIFIARPQVLTGVSPKLDWTPRSDDLILVSEMGWKP